MDSGIKFALTQNNTPAVVVKCGGKIGVSVSKGTALILHALKDKHELGATDLGPVDTDAPVVAIYFDNPRSVETFIEGLTVIKKNLETAKDAVKDPEV